MLILIVVGVLPSMAHAQLPAINSAPRVLHQPPVNKSANHKPANRTPAIKHPSVSSTQTQPTKVRQVSHTDPISVESYDQIACEQTCKQTVGWISAEWLFWSTKGVEFPSLATTSPAGTAQTAAGVLPAATTLFGGDRLHGEGRSGGRYSLGGWIDQYHTKSFEVSYLQLNDISESFSASANDFSILARPFFNTTTEIENARLLNFDGLITGDMAISSFTEFQTYEFLLRRGFTRPNGSRTAFVVGYRGANLEDMLRIEESTTALSGLVAGSSFDLLDQFDTENEFHGITFGYEYIGPVIRNGTLEFFGKVAVGATSSRVIVNGRTDTVTVTGDSSIVNAGFLTQGTNVGTFRDVDFDSLSEVGLRFRYHTSHDLDFFVGYSFLYWGQVARAGSQIDPGINVTQIPPGVLVGEERPRPPIDREGFWAQGLNLGFSYDF